MSEQAEKFETWASVVGFEGIYEVSNLARVRRVGRAAMVGNGRGGGARLGRVIATLNHRGGYKAVQLWKDGNMQRPLLHCVVADAFLGRRPLGKEVNHIDGNKGHNEHTNLEYVTRSENMLHAYATGLRVPGQLPTGESHHGSKLSDEQVREIRRLYDPGKHGTPRLAKTFCVDRTTIRAIVRGETWKELL